MTRQMFWKLLKAGGGGQPTGPLAQAINDFAEVAARQESVKELRPNVDLREEIALSEDDLRAIERVTIVACGVQNSEDNDRVLAHNEEDSIGKSPGKDSADFGLFAQSQTG
jgi:tRNA (Thr-GGU) A37 N-methylase